MTYDGSNRKHIRQAEKRSKLEENNEVAYLRQIMSTLSGRSWMHRHLVECAMFHEPFSPVSPYATAFNCGKQSVGRKLFDSVFTNCPTEYALMMQEAQAKESADGRRNDDTAEPTLSEQPGSTQRGRNDSGSLGYDTDDRGFVHDESAGYVSSAAEDGDASETTH